MSNTIDNRVVQMGFESKNFEKGAKKAIKYEKQYILGR